MSTRRGVGLSAFQNASSLSTSYATHGSNLRATHLTSLQTQLSVFQSLLHNFALTHASTIKSNPSFRAEFARMCNAVGVDPLAGTNVIGKGKGSWWGRGNVGDFYYMIAGRVVEVCRASRGVDGGLIALEECRLRVGRGRGLGGKVEVSEYVDPRLSLMPFIVVCVTMQALTDLRSYSDDILRAVKSLKPLGSGFSIVTVGSKQMIRSIPKELNTDQSTVLETIQVLGYVTCSMLEDNLRWEHARAETVIEDLLADSLVWVDLQAPEKEYWSPASINDFED